MRTKLLLALSLTACPAVPAAAESWYQIGTGDEEVLYANGDSIERKDNLATLDVFEGFKDAQGEGSDIFYTKGHLELDCSARKLRQLTFDTYGFERDLLPGAYFDMAWQPIQAGTAADGFAQVACEGASFDSSYPDPFDAADEYWNDEDTSDIIFI